MATGVVRGCFWDGSLQRKTARRGGGVVAAQREKARVCWRGLKRGGSG
jgi:hypothetical protein